MKTLRSIKTSVPSAGDYLELVRRFPLRRLRSETERRGASAIITELMVRGDDSLTDGEADYLEALGRFVADFERDHLAAALKDATPIEVLRHLMESRGMSPAQLGEVLGSRSAATMILRGQRDMSKTHIQAAAGYFGVSPAVFL